MPSCSSRRRASPAPATSSSPAPRTIPRPCGTLSRLGFADPPAVAALVRGWHHGRMRATRSQRAREILTELVPELLRIFGATPHPDEALRRFDQFLSRLPAGVQLFSLFQANPGLLALVADVMAGAPRLAEQLAQRPALLDAVLTAGILRAAAGARRCSPPISTAMLAGARRFRGHARPAAALGRARSGSRSACSCCAAALDGEGGGQALADIAETALAALLPAVEADFARRHGAGAGRRRCGARHGAARQPRDDARLRSRSDPDLRRAARQRRLRRRAAAVRSSAYYARLSQRLIGAITAPTAEGPLYPVDMRLRPSGASGPIASSLDSFDRYQRQSAWTWEHMALTRARPVAGDRGAVRADRRDDRRGVARAARPEAPRGRCRRHATAHRRANIRARRPGI